MTKIGDKLNCSDWRNGWTAYKITGETKQSWLLESGAKVNKKTLTSKNGKYSDTHWYTDTQRDDECWITTNRYRIVSRVQVCGNVDTLKKIEELLSA